MNTHGQIDGHITDLELMVTPKGTPKPGISDLAFNSVYTQTAQSLRNFTASGWTNPYASMSYNLNKIGFDNFKNIQELVINCN